jgi:hypothetical protein
VTSGERKEQGSRLAQPAMPDAKAGYLRRLEKVRDCSTNLLERCEIGLQSGTIFDLSAAHCAHLGTNPSSAASFFVAANPDSHQA